MSNGTHTTGTHASVGDAYAAPGATWSGTGVDFALRSRHATRVELCLFDGVGPEGLAGRQTSTVDLARTGDDGLWTAHVPELGPGALYGYRVHGPWAPGEGHRFNPAKLLVDPFARAISGQVVWNDALRAHSDGPLTEALLPEATDSAPWMPCSVVVDPAFDWRDDRRPALPWSRTVIYEAHVKGMTRLHPDVPDEQRGRYLGLAHPAVIEHLRSLGVTTLELLPVQQAAIEAHLARAGLVNYWGYATVGWFAPDARFASGGLGEQVREFKTMVRELHRAGIEVLIDVVYNHSGEGDGRGASLSLRGIDNASYYRQHPSLRGEYEDFTGCGNSLDLRHAEGLELVLASLRYWAEELHVDGFRFDLAPTLIRDPIDPNPAARLIEAVRADPLLSGLKLVAEPWDLGPNGFQLGSFPAGWSEWNSAFRDTLRDFWRSDHGSVARLSSALAGSRTIFEPSGRGPLASVNFVTCHDGFTLRDLVSYEHKHNERNGEENRDGTNENRSRNWGIEGAVDDAHVLAARDRARRCLLATLVLAHGVPMLSHGDELGRTQGGNNNAYCLDDEATWVAWRIDERERAFLGFCRRVLALRSGNAVFRGQRFLLGQLDAEGRKDVTWVAASGREMTPAAWRTSPGTLGMLLPAAFAEEVDELGRPVDARTALVLFNGSLEGQEFRLPRPGPQRAWSLRLDTGAEEPPALEIRSRIALAAHSLAVLELVERGGPA